MKRALWIALAVLLLVAATGYILTLEDVADVEEGEKAPALRPVTYVAAKVGDQAGTVSVFAEVTPRWQVDLKSRVAGVVGAVAPAALGGARVEKGTELLVLENAPYLANLEEARFSLKKAELELLQAEKKRDIALKDWRSVRPGVEPPDLAVHRPEVRVAELAVAAARARVGAAEYDLESAHIRAPFDAIITRRSVSPGQSVNEGDVLFALLDDRILDIRVSLTAEQWALLDRSRAETDSQVFSENNRFLGAARVKRGGGFLDPKSRRYQVFLEVDRAENLAILPGQFVSVRLPGKAVARSLRIPESALSQNGFVWYLDKADRLQRFAAQALFRNGEEVVVPAPASVPEGESLRIVPLPMSAYLPGQRVAPVEKENGA